MVESTESQKNGAEDNTPKSETVETLLKTVSATAEKGRVADAQKSELGPMVDRQRDAVKAYEAAAGQLRERWQRQKTTITTLWADIHKANGNGDQWAVKLKTLACPVLKKIADQSSLLGTLTARTLGAKEQTLATARTNLAAGKAILEAWLTAANTLAGKLDKVDAAIAATREALAKPGTQNGSLYLFWWTVYPQHYALQSYGDLDSAFSKIDKECAPKLALAAPHLLATSDELKKQIDDAADKYVKSIEKLKEAEITFAATPDDQQTVERQLQASLQKQDDDVTAALNHPPIP